MKSIVGALAILLASAAAASDAQPAWVGMNTEVMSESGALAVVDRIVSKLEAAVPTPTPEEQRYVAQERAFAEQLGKRSGGSYSSERVIAFESTKPFYESVVHQQVRRLRSSLNLIHALGASNQRFAAWADVMMSLSSVEPMENALAGLHRLGVINQSDVGEAEAVTWLRGPLEGKVQIQWPVLAETMWAAWGHAGLGRAVGLKSNNPAAAAPF